MPGLPRRLCAILSGMAGGVAVFGGSVYILLYEDISATWVFQLLVGEEKRCLWVALAALAGGVYGAYDRVRAATPSRDRD